MTEQKRFKIINKNHQFYGCKGNCYFENDEYVCIRIEYTSTSTASDVTIFEKTDVEEVTTKNGE